MAQRVVKFGNRVAAAVPGLTVKVAATSKGKHGIYVCIYTS